MTTNTNTTNTKNEKTTTLGKEFRLKIARCSYSEGISIVLLHKKISDMGNENWDFICAFAEVEIEQTNKEIDLFSHIPPELTRGALDLRQYVTFFRADLVDIVDETNGYYKRFYKNNTPEVELEVFTLENDTLKIKDKEETDTSDTNQYQKGTTREALDQFYKGLEKEEHELAGKLATSLIDLFDNNSKE